MFTVMIVEDELLVRIGLTESIPWEDLGLKVVAEESNGIDAYQTYQKLRPDIIIADIKIPGMSGLKLLQAIRKDDPVCALIVITCVEEFAVLKEMMALNVISYIVKATMEISDVIDTLKKARQSLKAHDRTENDRFDHLNLDSLLRAYLETRTLTPQELVKRIGNEPGADMTGFIHVRLSQTGEDNAILHSSIRTILSERFSQWLLASYDREDGSVLMFFKASPNPDQLAPLVRDLRVYVQTTFGVAIHFAVCLHGFDLPSLPDAIQACVARNDGADYLYRHGLMTLSPNGDLEDAALAECLKRLRDNSWVLGKDISGMELAKLVDQLEMSVFRGWSTLTCTASALVRYIASHTQLAPEAAQEFFQFIKEETDVYSLFARLNDVIVSPAYNQLPHSERPEIAAATEYIARHFASELSLTRVAREVGLHPTYFSFLFKQEMGINFVDYVGLLRMERARALMKDRSLSVQEISEMCGFSDVTYFYRRFKQATGMSPSAWRLRT